MPRYIVERTFQEGLDIPVNARGAALMAKVVSTNAADGVTWVHSYVSADHRKSFCIYDGPSPEKVRHAAACNQLPIDAIAEVQVLDPYCYRQRC